MLTYSNAVPCVGISLYPLSPTSKLRDDLKMYPHNTPKHTSRQRYILFELFYYDIRFITSNMQLEIRATSRSLHRIKSTIPPVSVLSPVKGRNTLFAVFSAFPLNLGNITPRYSFYGSDPIYLHLLSFPCLLRNRFSPMSCLTCTRFYNNRTFNATPPVFRLLSFLFYPRI